MGTRQKQTKYADIPPDKFWSKVLVGGPTECWPWKHNQKIFYHYGQHFPARSVAWFLKTGTGPKGKQIKSLCGNNFCMNAEHMALANSFEALEHRFWGFVDKKTEDECWPWLSVIHPVGYGSIGHGRKTLKAHRVAWEIHNGSPPSKGAVIMHSCDNPICVNPHHLRLGSHADNVADKVSKNRQAKGTRNGKSKLNEEKVRQIRKQLSDGEKIATMAKEYKIDPKVIRSIASGQTWSWVT